MLKLVETHDNLVAVPSYHYQPVFAQAVRAALAEFCPDAVAVELADVLAAEMDWLASCWPAPVASVTERSILPCVPGDSILEAYRLAKARKIPVFCVDLDVAGPIRRPDATLPGSEFAPRVGRQFRETNDALLEQAGSPTDGDLTREAFMAARLAELMKKHRRVLWVGGMAHWTRIVQRLENREFAGPKVEVGQSHTVCRVRLASTALCRMTGRLPFLLARYAKSPERYDESEAIRAVALAAGRSKAAVSVRIERQRGDDEDELLEPTSASVDVARMLIYARNLAASSGLREVPGLAELLTASSATMSNRYAGRLFLIAMRERLTAKSRSLPALTYEVENGKQGYRLNGQWLSAEPYWEPPGGAGVMWVIQQAEVDGKMREPYANVRAAKEGEKLGWAAYPSDETAYEAFVRYILEHASLPDSQESKSFVFQAGLRDGVDVRDTIRHWKEGVVYVREQANAQLRITNAIIDFSSRSERSWILRGEAKGKERAGWIDPSSSHVGTCSREATDFVLLQEHPFHVGRRKRDLSLVSLDCPNSLKDTTRKTFYDRIIVPLLDLPWRGTDNLYGWVEIFFRFCQRKTVAYYAAYVPSTRIQRIARKYHVRLVHIPLSRIPRPLLERNRTFRFMNLTRAQWEELLKAIADQKNAWVTERGENGNPKVQHES